MKKWIIATIAALAATTAQAVELKPEFRRVQLEENTMLNLSVMPDAGTQLVFPFELDNPDLKPSLKIRLTNPDGFSVPTDPKDIETLLQGQNTITIEGKANPNDPGAKYLGNLFITIGGYNISIALKTTYDTTQHVSNIIFDIKDETREHMIESAVARKTERLDKQYEEKMAALDEKAARLSLNHVAIMAMETPSTTNFKSDGRVPIDDYSITVFADKVTQFGQKYHILLFDLENRTSVDFTVQDLELVAIDGDRERTIEGSFECDPRLNADTTLKCSFATLEETMDDANRLQLKIVTDRGEGSFKW
jgi:hypothetical protein